jgi:hypothetical protein
LGDVVGVVDVGFASVTPCRVMQLRNAANAVELAPVFPPKPPKPPEPAGRRLAQALNAALSLELPPNPPAGGVPPPPNPPAGGVPPVPPAGRVPVGAVTPWDLRQLTNAVSEADDFVVVDVDFVVVDVVDFVDEEVEALPHAASNTPAKATPTIVTEIVRNFERLKLESIFPMGASMKRESG